ncbi:MAG TPA: xylose isomerase, partial [Cytophagaceae bacterium]
DGTLSQFRDLELALAESEGAEAVEWRIHFHVPIFLRDYHLLQSTQDDIIQTLHYLKTNAITKHLEVETYTWDVLPMGMRMGMKDGIVRELDWVLQNLKMEKA